MACGKSGDANYYQGTQGIQIEYLKGYPEREVYEQDPIPLVLTLKNNGAHDVPMEKLALTFSYNPLYLLRAQNEPVLFGNGTLRGRSAYYPEGGEHMVEVYDLITNPIVGQRESPTTQLSAFLCYEYKTHFASGVCIDVDSYLRTGREQACKTQDISASSQGAPVAFTRVEVRNNPVNTGGQGRFVRPEFIVTIRNVGQGVVISPPQADFTSACQISGLADKELNALFVNGTIFNFPLECTPNIVRLRDGEGKVRCTVKDEDLTNPAFALQQNIMTVLQLDAHYIYRDADFTDITIKRNPIRDDLGYVADDFPKVKGYAYTSDGKVVQDSLGNPMTICRQYAQGSGSPPAALPSMNKNWSCTCSKTDCLEMDENGFCVYGLCPGSQECCDATGFETFEKAVGR